VYLTGTAHGKRVQRVGEPRTTWSSCPTPISTSRRRMSATHTPGFALHGESVHGDAASSVAVLRDIADESDSGASRNDWTV